MWPSGTLLVKWPQSNILLTYKINVFKREELINAGSSKKLTWPKYIFSLISCGLFEKIFYIEFFNFINSTSEIIFILNFQFVEWHTYNL